jgi:glycosyltransferase involved in cell wall biosynthesis
MKIVEVLLRPAIGGAETLVEQLSTHWRSAGHTVSTVYVDPSGQVGGRFSRVANLARAFREADPDVVHAHAALPNLYARLASRGRWPVVTVLHSAVRDFDDPTLRTAERALPRWTSHVIAVSPGQVLEYRDAMGDRVPISLVPNGVRADIVCRTAPAPRLSRLVAISRLVPQKRMDVLFAGWRRAGLDAELQVAGVAPDAATQRQVEAWAAEAPGGTLLGRVDDVPTLLAHSDLLVHTADSEAHGGLVPVEAACAGIPVVVSSAVAVDLPRDLAAVTFPTGDPDGLAAALREAADNYPALARAAIDRAPALAEEFSLAACAERHLDVLRRSVSARSRDGVSA